MSALSEGGPWDSQAHVKMHDNNAIPHNLVSDRVRLLSALSIRLNEPFIPGFIADFCPAFESQTPNPAAANWSPRDAEL
jgi:hypothetical protein